MKFYWQEDPNMPDYYEVRVESDEGEVLDISGGHKLGSLVDPRRYVIEGRIARSPVAGEPLPGPLG